MFKKGIIKTPEDMYIWSVFTVFIFFLIGLIFAIFSPYVEISIRYAILDSVIRLDGVLFGFSAVMIGLFVREFRELSRTTMKRCLMFGLLSFWSYILSISISFLIMAFNQTSLYFVPINLVIIGSICSSINLVLVLAEEVFSSEKVQKS